MKKYTKEELKIILDKHLEWLLDNSKGERANLREADLCRTDLRGANLCGAILGGAILGGADLRWSDLSGANLCKADLRGANLSEANLVGTILSDTCINTFSLGRHSGYSWTNSDGELIIRIGCKEMKASQWKDEYVAVGKSQGYTDKQIKLYGMILKCLRINHKEK